MTALNTLNLALITCLLQAIAGSQPIPPVYANSPQFPQGPSIPIPPLQPGAPTSPRSPADPGFLSALSYVTKPVTLLTNELGNAASVIPVVGTIVKGVTDGVDRLNENLTTGNDADAVIGILQAVTGTLDSTVKGLTSDLGIPVGLDTVCVAKTVPHIVPAYNNGNYLKGAADGYQAYSNCKGEGLLTHTIGDIGHYVGSSKSKWIDYPDSNLEVAKIFLKSEHPKQVSKERSSEILNSYIPERNGTIMKIVYKTDLKNILEDWVLVNSLRTTPLLSSIEVFNLPEDYAENVWGVVEEIKDSKLGVSLIDFATLTDWPTVKRQFKQLNFTEIQNQLVKAGTAEALEIAKDNLVPKSISSFFSFGKK